MEPEQGDLFIGHISQLWALRKLKLWFTDLASLEQADQLQIRHLRREPLHDLSCLEYESFDDSSKFLILETIKEVIDTLNHFRLLEETV